MQKVTFEELVERIVAEDPRFQAGAYSFVREALEYTQEKHAPVGQETERHVNGRQLLDGIRDYALRQYGPMAMTLFEEWGVRRCEDFGEIVFRLIDRRILRKTDTDSREDFKGGYDFDEAFRRPFVPVSQRGLPAPRTPPAPPQPEKV